MADEYLCCKPLAFVHRNFQLLWNADDTVTTNIFISLPSSQRLQKGIMSCDCIIMVTNIFLFIRNFFWVLRIAFYKQCLVCIYFFLITRYPTQGPTNPETQFHRPLAEGPIKAPAKPHMDLPNSRIDSPLGVMNLRHWLEADLQVTGLDYQSIPWGLLCLQLWVKCLHAE